MMSKMMSIEWHDAKKVLPVPQAKGGVESTDILIVCDGMSGVYPSVYSRHGFGTYHDIATGNNNAESAYDDVIYWAYMPTAEEVAHEFQQ